MGELTTALRETLDVFADDGTPLSTTEVATELDLGRRSTYDRLDRLVDADELRTKKVGASARVWWRKGTGESSTDPADRGHRGNAVDSSTLVDVLESSPAGVASFTEGGSLRYVNDRFRTLFALDDGDVSFSTLNTVTMTDVDGDAIASAERPVRRALRTNQSVDQHVRIEHGDDGHRWLSVNVRRSDDGVVVTATDATDVVERRRRLRRERDGVEAEFAEFAGHAVDGWLELDEDDTVRSIDERAAALLGATTTGLVGESTTEAFDALPGATAVVAEALETGSTRSGDCRHERRDAWFEVEAVPTAAGVSVTLREATEQVERERELERYVGVVDALGEPVYELDDEGRFAFVNDAVTELSGYSREELLGEHVSMVIPEDAVARIEPQFRELLAADVPERLRSEYDVTTKRGERVPVENRLALLTDDAGEVRGNAGIVSDITERKARNRELERYERIVETVEDGIYVLDENDRFVVVNDAFASMAGVEGEEIIGREASLVFDEAFVERANHRQAALSTGTMESAKLEGLFSPVDGDPLVVETRFTTFLSEDENRGRVGVVRDVGERVQRERRIERQRARLEALNEVNAVVRDVATGAIDGSNREEIEAMVCERFAASNSYEFAWIAEITGVDGSLSVRTAAGLDDDPDGRALADVLGDVRGGGAIGQALRERAAQTVMDASLLPTSDPWRELVARHGFESAVAIPITHDGRMFGVLNVHTSRESAFADEERRVVEHVGDVVGHAIAAVERKRALASEAVLELDYRVPDVFSSLDASESLAGRLTFDETVSTKGEEVIVYGTASPAALESLDALVDELSYWESVTVVDRDGETAKFELRATDPPVFSSVTSRGGYVDQVIVVDGDSRIVVHLPPGQDVRAVTEEVTEAYSSAELVAQRQVSRPQPSTAQLQERIADALTDRQRAALDAAYHSGFFEWPRAATGEDVAAAMGVAPPTFNQHIRKAERKVLEALLSSPTESVTETSEKGG